MILTENSSRGHNLIEEKYGRMMESTAPQEYEEIKERFPVLSEKKKQIIEQIVALQVAWMEAFAEEYPHLADNARVCILMRIICIIPLMRLICGESSELF